MGFFFFALIYILRIIRQCVWCVVHACGSVARSHQCGLTSSLHLQRSSRHVSAGSRHLSSLSLRHSSSLDCARCPLPPRQITQQPIIHAPDKLVGGPARGPASGSRMTDTVGDETLSTVVHCAQPPLHPQSVSVPRAYVLRPQLPSSLGACGMSVWCVARRDRLRAKRKKGRRPTAPLAPPPDRQGSNLLRLPGCPLPTRRRARHAHQAGRPSRRRTSVVAAAAFLAVAMAATDVLKRHEASLWLHRPLAAAETGGVECAGQSSSRSSEQSEPSLQHSHSSLAEPSA